MRVQLKQNPRYMAPEILACATYDGSADIFSFGVLLYELLSGQIAYGSGTKLDGKLALDVRQVNPGTEAPSNPGSVVNVGVKVSDLP